MATTLLTIRVLQLKRELQLLPLFHKILFLSSVCGAIIVCNGLFQKRDTAWEITGFLLLIFAIFQVYRPDKNFIFLHLFQPRKAIFLEYVAVAFPFIIPALFSQNWYCFFIFLLCLVPITFIRVSVSLKTNFTFLGRIFPASAFEWISGFRKGLPVILIIYSLALIFCRVKALPILLLWVLCGIISGIYQQCESLQILRANPESPATFIRNKIKLHCLLLLVICLPVLILQTIFHPILGIAGLVFLILQGFVIAFAICLKYSVYQPDADLSGNMILLVFSQLSVVLPFFLLLPIILTLRHYRLAKHNLKYYLLPC